MCSCTTTSRLFDLSVPIPFCSLMHTFFYAYIVSFFNENVQKGSPMLRKKVRKLRFVEKVDDTAPGISHQFAFNLTKSQVKGKIVLNVGSWTGNYEYLLRGWASEVVGIDIEKKCLITAKRKLPTIEFICASVLHLPFIKNYFDVVTMWFVIEHFSRLDHVLTMVNNLLKPGGVFALSTPNGAGISARRNLNSFLEKNPPDHYTVWSPALSASILQRFGFHMRKIVITGHHPERFPCADKKLVLQGSITGRFLAAVSRIFRLGDTIEVYSEKIRNVGGD